jgi:predicted transcriptional regulator
MTGKELKAMRKRVQSIQWFADMVGVSRSTLESYECGRLPIIKEREKRIREIFERIERA